MGLGHSLVDASDSDDHLMERARAGDSAAFEALYLRHRATARRIALVLTASSADADDAVAEGFTRLLAALPRLAGRPVVFRAYLITTIKNVVTDRHRRLGRIEPCDEMPERSWLAESDERMVMADEQSLVRQALDGLPARWRTVLWLTAVEGLSPAEVGRRIGVSPAAVAALAYRSRQKLRLAYHQLDDAVGGARPGPSRLTAAA
ncbi:MAG: RNA polymerase sigma factor [Acidimicrobiia bacterium]